jgi:poly(A) polymerase
MLATIHLLQKYNLMSQLFIYSNTSNALVDAALANTDQRINQGKTVSPAFLFAAILWHPVLEQVTQLGTNGMPIYLAYERALQTVLEKQTERLTIPRLMQLSIREICLLQYRFSNRRGKQPYRLLEHPRFRAAYDLLLLRAQAEENAQELAGWWQQFYSALPEEREKILNERPQTAHTKKRYKGRRRQGNKHKVKSI